MALPAPAPDPVRIQELARSLGEPIAPEALTGLSKFAALFLAWNARINLSGVRTAEALVDRHLSDAFAAVRFVGPGDRVVDVGSGGGLPVVPMALLRSGARFELFEPTGKKVAFLRTSIRELGMGGRVIVHASRMELPCPPEFRRVFDVACSRATLPVAQWLALGRELVQPSGRVLVFGTDSEQTGLPQHDQQFIYGSNRRVLVFAAS